MRSDEFVALLPEAAPARAPSWRANGRARPDYEAPSSCRAPFVRVPGTSPPPVAPRAPTWCSGWAAVRASAVRGWTPSPRSGSPSRPRPWAATLSGGERSGWRSPGLAEPAAMLSTSPSRPRCADPPEICTRAPGACAVATTRVLLVTTTSTRPWRWPTGARARRWAPPPRPAGGAGPPPGIGPTRASTSSEPSSSARWRDGLPSEPHREPCGADGRGRKPSAMPPDKVLLWRRPCHPAPARGQLQLEGFDVVLAHAARGIDLARTNGRTSSSATS